MHTYSTMSMSPGKNKEHEEAAETTSQDETYFASYIPIPSLHPNIEPKISQMNKTEEFKASAVPPFDIEGEGVEDMYDNGRLVETIEYNYHAPSQKFMHKATLYVDEPFVPEGYQKGFYREILELRLKRGEDHQVADSIKKFLDFEDALKPAEYALMVHLMLHSYPILQFRYKKLFDRFRRTCLVYHDRNVVQFRNCIISVADCLNPYSSCPVGPLEDLDPEDIDPNENPIVIMDFLYTLRVWNKRTPFSCVFFSKNTIEAAEQILFGYDMVKYGMIIKSGPFSDEIEEYIEKKSE